MTLSKSNHPPLFSRLSPALFILFVLQGCTEQITPVAKVTRPMPLFELTDRSVERRVFTGRAKAVQEVDLAFRVHGPLIERRVDVGDTVTAGQLLARIDPQDLTIALESAKARMTQVASELAFYEREYQRGFDISQRDSTLISQAELDRRKRNMETTRASLAVTKAAMTHAEDNLRYTELRAPFAGQVTLTYVENFEDVQAKQPTLRILDTSRVEVVVDIPEQLISSVNRVESISVRFDAFPDLDLDAEIKEISSEADPVTRTYPITLIMDQPEGQKVLPGMAGRATATQTVASEEGGFLIPFKALGEDTQQHHFVWRYVEQTQNLQKVEVKTKAVRSNGVLVHGPLQHGDRIALAGIYQVHEGQQVAPYQEGAAL